MNWWALFEDKHIKYNSNSSKRKRSQDTLSPSQFPAENQTPYNVALTFHLLVLTNNTLFI